ncbi:MAG: hypothetical protein HYR58_02895 [Acidobacteria bacterium]|nr:hypothetical protein [Acidobacteriota bacterium]
MHNPHEGWPPADSTKINIKIDGNMSAGAARAAALEVIANFGKADFGK